MTSIVEHEPIQRERLVARVSDLKKDGYHLVQISCTAKPDLFEITYSFDKNYKLVNLRVELPRQDPKVASLTPVFFAAFTYENELQEFFGVKVEGLNPDFGGKFYRLAEPTPFAACASVGKPAAPPAAPQGGA